MKNANTLPQVHSSPSYSVWVFLFPPPHKPAKYGMILVSLEFSMNDLSRIITFSNPFATNLNDLSGATKLIPQTPLLPGGVLLLPRLLLLLLPRPSLPVLPLTPPINRLPVRQQLLRHVRLRKGFDFLVFLHSVTYLSLTHMKRRDYLDSDCI